MKIYDCPQGSDDWFAARLGIPTASEFKSVLAKGEGKTRRTYMMTLLGERLTGEPAQRYSNDDMARGKAMEAEARAHYALVHDVEPRLVGFIRNIDVGCSPDSLIGNNGMLEIKTKLPHLQLEVLLAGKLPPEHRAQVQGALWVAEREWLDFVSYWPKLPLFTVRVTRDEEYIAKLSDEIDRFNEELSLYEQNLRAAAA